MLIQRSISEEIMEKKTSSASFSDRSTRNSLWLWAVRVARLYPVCLVHALLYHCASPHIAGPVVYGKSLRVDTIHARKRGPLILVDCLYYHRQKKRPLCNHLDIGVLQLPALHVSSASANHLPDSDLRYATAMHRCLGGCGEGCFFCLW